MSLYFVADINPRKQSLNRHSWEKNVSSLFEEHGFKNNVNNKST